MKKTLISIVLATFCLSVPVFGSALETITPAADATPVANSTITPMLGQPGFRRRRYRRERRWVVRRHYRRVYRRHRFIIRHRRH